MTTWRTATSLLPAVRSVSLLLGINSALRPVNSTGKSPPYLFLSDLVLKLKLKVVFICRGNSECCFECPSNCREAYKRGKKIYNHIF